MLQHPYVRLPAARRPVALGVAFLGTAALMTFLYFQGEPLRTSPGTSSGIVDYELALTAERVNDIKDLWEGKIETARKQIWYDFPFLVFYPVFLSLACALLSENRFEVMPRQGVFLSWAVLACGPLDFVENCALLHMLTHTPTDLLAGLAGGFAAVKFLLVAAAMMYIIGVGIGTAVETIQGR